MTEKRYSNGTLAKWYYSRNNVISDGTNEYYLGSKESIRDWNYDDLLGTNDLLDELNRLSDENEKLKKELKKYTDAFDCSQCRFQNYDWFDDGDEFEVCEKGNNEAQMENHSCSEWEEI